VLTGCQVLPNAILHHKQAVRMMRKRSPRVPALSTRSNISDKLKQEQHLLIDRVFVRIITWVASSPSGDELVHLILGH
jgi:hypothetical protein